MTLFALSFLVVYSLMHLLVWLGMRPLLPTGRRWRVPLAAWSGLMVLTPVLTRLLERSGYDSVARATAWIGYLWMGFLWLAFALFTAQGLWNGAMRLGGRGWPVLRNWQLAGRRPALLALVSVAIAGSWAFYAARQVQVETVRLSVTTLPAGMQRLRIVQVSDLHLGLINREWLLGEVVTRIRELQPDLLAVTGDLVDAQRNHLDSLIVPWQQLKPPLGKFAVIGNHEVYAGRSHALDYLQQAGFRVLLNELVSVAGVQVAGVTDPAWGERSSDSAILSQGEPGRMTLLLKHRPWVETAAAGRFTLQLSGHAHRGQIFPFNLLTGFAYPMQDGLYQQSAASWLYTSRGTGTWGPPMRLFAPPELTLIELTAEQPVH